MDFTRKSFSGGYDAIWRGEAKVLPGGYAPVDSLPAGAVVRRGTPIEVDVEDLQCKIGKSATVSDGAGTTLLQVAKGHLFVVGDTITDGSASAAITAIDTSNSGYDVLTVATALSGAAIYSPITPNAVVAADYVNDGLGAVVVDAAYEACVLYKVLAAPIVAAWKDGLHLVGNPSIKLITQ